MGQATGRINLFHTNVKSIYMLQRVLRHWCYPLGIAQYSHVQNEKKTKTKKNKRKQQRKTKQNKKKQDYMIHT